MPQCAAARDFVGTFLTLTLTLASFPGMVTFFLVPWLQQDQHWQLVRVQ